MAGEIRIADRNYAKAGKLYELRQRSEDKADFIVRIGWRTLRLSTPAGHRFDLIAHLDTLPDDGVPHEVAVLADTGTRTPALPLRLIIVGKPPEAAEALRRKLPRQAQHKQKALDPRTVVAAGFMILATSLPRQGYPAAEIDAAYRLRWQIELAFKRLKSLLHIDQLPTRTAEASRSWLLAHLVLALLCDGVTQELLESFPQHLYDAGCLPSLWRLHAKAAMVIRLAIIGRPKLEDLIHPKSRLHRRLATAPRTRKPQIKYPLNGVF